MSEPTSGSNISYLGLMWICSLLYFWCWCQGSVFCRKQVLKALNSYIVCAIVVCTVRLEFADFDIVPWLEIADFGIVLQPKFAFLFPPACIIWRCFTRGWFIITRWNYIFSNILFGVMRNFFLLLKNWIKLIKNESKLFIWTLSSLTEAQFKPI